MKHFKKIVSVLLLLCMVAGSVAFAEPEKAKAWNTGDGTVSVYNLDNDYKDGLYRIWEKIVYNKYSDEKNNGHDLTIYNQYLSNSAGKKVATWKDWSKLLTQGGSKSIYYGVYFSKLPSDVYTLHITVYSNYHGNYVNYTRKIAHSAGKISFVSGKYQTDTTGDRYLRLVFSIKQMKGYVPKLEIFDSKGNKIFSRSNYSKVAYDDSTYWFNWDFSSNSGAPVYAGDYTFKVTCNGKSCSKKLTLK